jgi:hypothetical protein
MVRFARITSLILALAFSASAASATVCGPRADIISTLEGRFKEKIRGLGVTGDETGLVELYVSPEGTFSIVITDKLMTSCVMYVGNNWQGGGEDAPVKESNGENSGNL